MSVKAATKAPATAANHKHSDEATASHTRSMFHVSLGRTREKILLQRLIVAAWLPNGLSDRTELAAHYEKLNLQLSRRFSWDHMTGLLLLYPSCLLHVTESSREVLVSVLEDLVELQQRSDCTFLKAPKIVFMAHNPHSRLFQQWSYKVLNVALDQDDGSKENEEEPTDSLVHKVLSSLKTIAKPNEHSKKVLVGPAIDQSGISPDVLVKLLAREELQTPQQFLKSYDSPLHISIDFGQVKRSSCLTTV